MEFLALGGLVLFGLSQNKERKPLKPQIPSRKIKKENKNQVQNFRTRNYWQRNIRRF